MHYSYWLGNSLFASIDRPLGSHHPVHRYVYPVNYGYIPGTLGSDGEEVDAYILGINEPLAEFTGLCIAVIHRLNDDDDKLILVPSGYQPTNDQIITATFFQERWFTSEIIR